MDDLPTTPSWGHASLLLSVLSCGIVGADLFRSQPVQPPFTQLISLALWVFPPLGGALGLVGLMKDQGHVGARIASLLGMLFGFGLWLFFIWVAVDTFDE